MHHYYVAVAARLSVCLRKLSVSDNRNDRDSSQQGYGNDRDTSQQGHGNDRDSSQQGYGNDRDFNDACGIRSSCVEYGYSWVNNTIPGCYCLRIHVIDMVDSALQDKED